jgi:hypothetical protein
MNQFGFILSCGIPVVYQITVHRVVTSSHRQKTMEVSWQLHVSALHGGHHQVVYVRVE